MSKPTFYAYAVKQRDKGQKDIWTRIGAAFTHKKGDGLTIELDALPVDGKIVLMPPKDEAEAGER